MVFYSNLTRQIWVLNDGHLLSINSHTTFLGVILQGNKKENKFCLSYRALRAYNILKSLADTNWGSDPKNLLTLHIRVISN